jgi:hypothetical protein
MGDLKGRIRKLEEELTGEMITIPQLDGTLKRFPPGAGKDALLNFIDRIGRGEDAPAEHPLMEATRNSSEPKWAGSFFAINDPDQWVQPIEDLSEH